MSKRAFVETTHSDGVGRTTPNGILNSTSPVETRRECILRLNRLLVGNSRFVTSLVVAGSFAGCLFPEYGEMQRSGHPALGETAGAAGSGGNAGMGGEGGGDARGVITGENSVGSGHAISIGGGTHAESTAVGNIGGTNGVGGSGVGGTAGPEGGNAVQTSATVRSSCVAGVNTGDFCNAAVDTAICVRATRICTCSAQTLEWTCTPSGAGGSGGGDGSDNKAGAPIAGAAGAGTCGDGVVNRSVNPRTRESKEEDCDEGMDPLTGGREDSATCNRDCTAARCGDGYVNQASGEICDDGEHSSLKCTGNVLGNPEKSCKPTWCGDGVVTNAISPATGRPFEECDPGIDGAACDDDCTKRNCGDGFVNRKAYTNSSGVTIAAEECDEGPDDGEHCDSDCTWSVCGDGHVNTKAGEECDKALGGNCSAECKVSTCGDGKVDSSRNEQCDPGPNGQNARNCRPDCKISFCGDSYVNTRAMETCDDGNSLNGDGCGGSCQVESGWKCLTAGGPCTRSGAT